LMAPKHRALFHPDYDRRPRNYTGSADPNASTETLGARGLMRSLAITAGGDLHPALRTLARMLPDDNRLGRLLVSRQDLAARISGEAGEQLGSPARPRINRSLAATGRPMARLIAVRIEHCADETVGARSDAGQC
jgi:hypothetical protein